MKGKKVFAKEKIKSFDETHENVLTPEVKKKLVRSGVSNKAKESKTQKSKTNKVNETISNETENSKSLQFKQRAKNKKKFSLKKKNYFLENLSFIFNFLTLISILFLAIQTKLTFDANKSTSKWESSRLTIELCENFLQDKKDEKACLQFFLGESLEDPNIIDDESLIKNHLAPKVESLKRIQNLNYKFMDFLGNFTYEQAGEEFEAVRKGIQNIRFSLEKFSSHFLFSGANEELGYELCGNNYLLYFTFCNSLIIPPPNLTTVGNSTYVDYAKSSSLKLYEIWIARYKYKKAQDILLSAENAYENLKQRNFKEIYVENGLLKKKRVEKNIINEYKFKIHESNFVLDSISNIIINLKHKYIKK